MSESITLTTAGESHGPAVTVILGGVPAGLRVVAAEIDEELQRRQVGYGRGGRMQIESDRVLVRGGIRHGLTLGSPVCLVVENRDWQNWREEMSPDPPSAGWQSERSVTVPRPGHADLAGAAKFGHVDMRNVLERASARETAARVAGGGVCKLLLGEIGVDIRSRTVAIAGVRDETAPADDAAWERAEASDVRCADAQVAGRMREAIDEAGAAGDSVGGVVEIVADGVPPGLGGYASWTDRLDGRLAQAVMSVPAIKGVEIGAGFEAADVTGSKVHDVIARADDGSGEAWPFGRPTNNAGGLEGGTTNGARVVVRAAMKPIPTLTRPLGSVNVATGEDADAHAERSDVCAVPAAGVVAEAMVALVLASAAREKFGGDCVGDMKAAWQSYLDRLALPWVDRS